MEGGRYREDQTPLTCESRRFQGVEGGKPGSARRGRRVMAAITKLITGQSMREGGLNPVRVDPP